MKQPAPALPAQHGSGQRVSLTTLLYLLGPSLGITVLLFGGGLFLGFLQALGHLPSLGFNQLSLQHFQKVFTDPDFPGSLGITLYISTVSTIIAALLSIFVSLAMMKWASNSRLINFILQIPLTAPHLVVAIAILLLLSPSGFFARILNALSIVDKPSVLPLLVNDRWCIGIIIVYIWKEVPFITLMLLSILKNIGPELLEVSATLNASRQQRFFYVILPLISPNLVSSCLIVFAYTFGSFEVPYLLGQTYPTTLSVWAYRSYSDVDLLARPEGIALGLLIALVITAIILVPQLLIAFRQRER